MSEHGASADHRPLVIATHNPGKLREMRELLALYGIEAVSAGELGLAEPEETGTTFRDNARIKADAAAKASGLPAFADDSGLAVDALDGEPGIHSARWAGPDKDFGARMQTIEAMLRERGATAPAQRSGAFRLGALRRLAGRACRGIRGHGRRHAGLAAARRRRASATIRCSCRTGTTAPSAKCRREEKHGLPPRGKGLSHRARAS